MRALLANKKSVAVLDTFFGDSGKGKIVDYLASMNDSGKPFFHMVYRPNGGPNTGHTINVENKKYVFHLIPSAALISGIDCFIGRAVAFEPRCFFQELSQVLDKNPDAKICIDYNTHIIMPWHIALDNLREVSNTGKIGTTGKGVGPCMETKNSRKGFVTVEMLLPKNSKLFIDVVDNAIKKAEPELNFFTENFNGNVNEFLRSINLPLGMTLAYFFKDKKLDRDKIIEAYLEYGKKLEPMASDVLALIKNRLKSGERVLVEGTQGVFLDLDHGTYPFVTAGLTTRAGLEHAAGIYFDLCINVVKSYATRVGNGPFPTELADDLGNNLRDSGNEFGSTTGRPRRVGWLDAVALKYAVELNTRNDEKPLIALTKLDVLEGFSPMICDEYKITSNPHPKFSKEFSITEIENAKIGHCFKFERIESIKGISSFNGLPQTALNYIKKIEDITSGEIVIVGNGPERESVIVK